MTLSINDTKHEWHSALMTLSMTFGSALPLYCISHFIYCYAEWHSAKWPYAECRYSAKCHCTECYGAFEATSFYKAFEEMKDSDKYLIEKTCCSE
jgi:hypothetical protein